MRTRHDSRGNELARAEPRSTKKSRLTGQNKGKTSQNKPRQTVQTGFSYGIYTGLVVCGTLTLVRGNLDRPNLSFFKLLMCIGTTLQSGMLQSGMLQSGMPQYGMPQYGMPQSEALQPEALQPEALQSEALQPEALQSEALQSEALKP